MGKKDRLRRKKLTEPPPAPPHSSRFRFFLWISAFFFLAALLIMLDDITAWPGAEARVLDHALSNERGSSLLTFLYGLLLPLGEGIDQQTEAIWLFPRLLSTASVLLTGFFTYRLGGKLFGTQATGLGLLCAGASLFLPFFGKVATPDALALLGQSGFFWCILLAGADREKNYLLPAGIFLFLAGVAAPLSTLISGMAVILAGRLIFGGGKQWLNLLILLALPLTVLLLQGNQGTGRYWFWGENPLGYGRFLAYTLLGMLPLTGWLLAGLRDLVYKVRQGEMRGQLFAAGLSVGFLTQSLLFPLLLALLAGKQMQLFYRAENYPWKDWVKGGSVVHLVGAFVAVVMTVLTLSIYFPRGQGFSAALGMGAAYWIFSLLGVLGLYGERRDFALGGSVLAGLLVVLFFWVQVYPYLEVGRGWPRRMAAQVEVPLPTFVPEERDFTVALPYLRKANIPVVTDSLAADQHLVSWEPTDSLRTADIEITGRTFLNRRVFGLTVER
ncbi:MAG: hypothetical protein AAFZ52_12270 [Bacteroidota bacterium]